MLTTRPLNAIRFHALLALSALCLLALSACGAAPATPVIPAPLAASWVGQLEGTDAFIGLVSNGTELMAYVCGSPSVSVSQWFHGQAGVDQLDLVAGTVNLTAASTATLQAQLTQTTATGKVTLADGQTFSFQATRATGDAGLYRSDETTADVKSIGGWIVLNDGQLRGYVEQDNLVSHRRTLEAQTNLSNLARVIDPSNLQY